MSTNLSAVFIILQGINKFEVVLACYFFSKIMQRLFTKNYLTFTVETAEGQIIKEFIGATKAGKALLGDLVEANEDGCTLLTRVEHPPLVGVIDFTSKIRYGFTPRNVPLYLFTPYNEAYPPMLVASKHVETGNIIAVAVFEHWDEGTFPRGGLVKIVGTCGCLDSEKTAVALQYSPWSWTKKMMQELVAPVKEGRLLLHKPTINIDPQGCQDIDDVVSLWEENGLWKIAISISDVAAFLLLNPFLEFAEKIGQTLYTHDGKVVRPMFPPRLSEDIFSLIPGEERFCISLIAQWDGENLFNFEWKETILTNWASYTYENCYDAKEIDISILKSIVTSLNYDKTDSHKWVEALMILYNTKAAEVLKTSEAGLLRVHNEPMKERLALIESLGLPAKKLAYPAANYATTDVSGGHWGLAKARYCHASSPIRRYADIINQITLKSVIHNLPTFSLPSYKKYALNLNRLEKAGKAYDRDCDLIDCVLGHPGTPVNGLVIDSGEKTSIYVSNWERIIRCNTGVKLNPGDSVILGFYAKTGRSWKRKIVYHVEKI